MPAPLPLPAPTSAASAHWLPTMGSWAGLMSYSEIVASDFCMKWNFVIWGKTYQLLCHVFSLRKYDTNSKQMTYSFMEPYLVVFCCKESTCNAGDPNSIPGLGGSAGEGIGYPLQYSWASLVAQLVKNLPAKREIWVRSLGWEDPLEKGKATQTSILAWRIPWTVSSMG